MRKTNQVLGELAVLFLVPTFFHFLLPSQVCAETVEIVTYYPSVANLGDLHARSATVGNDFQNITPGDGYALISSGIFVRGGSGQVTGSNGLVPGDALGVQAYLNPMGTFMLTPEQYARADVNGDGQVTQLDYYLISNMLDVNNGMTLDQARAAGKRLATGPSRWIWPATLRWGPDSGCLAARSPLREPTGW